VPAVSISDALLSYPQDLLSSPLHVPSMQASFAPGVSVEPVALGRRIRTGFANVTSCGVSS